MNDKKKDDDKEILAGFELTRVLPWITEAAQSLTRSLNQSGVKIKGDAVYLALQNLVLQMGNMQVATASAEVIKPTYNHSAEFFVLAKELWDEGKHEESIMSLVTAMQAPDAKLLANGLDQMNEAASQASNEGEEEEKQDKDLEDGTKKEEATAKKETLATAAGKDPTGSVAGKREGIGNALKRMTQNYATLSSDPKVRRSIRKVLADLAPEQEQDDEQISDRRKALREQMGESEEASVARVPQEDTRAVRALANRISLSGNKDDRVMARTLVPGSAE